MTTNLISFSFALVILQSCTQPSTKRKKLEFESEIVNALNLKLVNKDDDYQYSRLNIYNDTIVGLYTYGIKDEEYKYFFYQSINEPKNKIKFNNFELRYPSISSIDYYRNGCLYFGEFGGGTMQSLCADGTLTKYFKKYEDTLFYANRVMLYEKKAVITSMNGVYVFDINKEELTWKYKYVESPKEGHTDVIGEKLLITESISNKKKAFTRVTCYDLKKSTVVWIKLLENDANYLFDQEYVPHYSLYRDSGNVIIPQVRACYALDLTDGEIIGKVPWNWKGEPPIFTAPQFRVEANTMYFFNGQDLICINILTNEKIWSLRNTRFDGLYKEYVIGHTLDLEFYLIIDKKNGKILHKISKPKSNHMDFDFIDKYILINHTSIYK